MVGSGDGELFSQNQIYEANGYEESELRNALLHNIRLRDNMSKDRDNYEKKLDEYCETSKDLIKKVENIAKEVAPIVRDRDRFKVMYESEKEIAIRSQKQINNIADFIMAEIDGEPSQSEGAAECAIRLLRKAYVKKDDV